MNYAAAVTCQGSGKAGKVTPTVQGARLYPELPKDDFPPLSSKDNIPTNLTPLTTERSVNCVSTTLTHMSGSVAQRETQHSTNDDNRQSQGGFNQEHVKCEEGWQKINITDQSKQNSQDLQDIIKMLQQSSTSEKKENSSPLSPNSHQENMQLRESKPSEFDCGPSHMVTNRQRPGSGSERDVKHSESNDSQQSQDGLDQEHNKCSDSDYGPSHMDTNQQNQHYSHSDVNKEQRRHPGQQDVNNVSVHSTSSSLSDRNVSGPKKEDSISQGYTGNEQHGRASDDVNESQDFKEKEMPKQNIPEQKKQKRKGINENSGLTEHVEGSERGARPKDTYSHRRGHYQRHDWGNVEHSEEAFEVDPALVEKYKDDNKSKFEYFWRSESVYSQWCMTEFVVDERKYNCAEQFMMHRKAMLFEDFKTAKKIMETKSPRKQKQLGRQVRYFDEELWQANCDAIVEEGNMAKFSQNKELLNIICASNPKMLVEASPLDRIWGIGLSSDDPRAWNRATWNGENKLGKALTKIRCQLMLEKGLILKEEYDQQLKELEH
ncbi:uncharacterized protein [Argopecten irradians]|uniref:uncharacterized protein n=1 Tax=Argopecten irradians TaxID=31199 RepID=UPI003720C3D8